MARSIQLGVSTLLQKSSSFDKQGSDSSVLNKFSPTMIILFVFSCENILAFLKLHKLYSSGWVEKWYNLKSNH